MFEQVYGSLYVQIIPDQSDHINKMTNNASYFTSHC